MTFLCFFCTDILFNSVSIKFACLLIFFPHLSRSTWSKGALGGKHEVRTSHPSCIITVQRGMCTPIYNCTSKPAGNPFVTNSNA